MLFNSDIFLFFFLPITLLGYFLCYKTMGNRSAMVWLVISSLFYYGWWNYYYLILITTSISVNYFIGKKVIRAQKFGHIKTATSLMYLGISFNLCLLGYYKYANFFLEAFDQLTGFNYQLVTVILPVGISFFTFQQIAFLIDAKKGEIDHFSALDYALFVLFFPQLIAGPIVHHREMLPQFAQDDTFKPKIDNISIGLTMFVIGLMKKVLIADNWALLATPMFEGADGGQIPHAATAWIGTFSYSMQLYFDFSGYSDMAIGIARMFGVRLPLNFQSPYRAKSIIDFWRRWHMTLSRFLRDYLYIALGGNKKGRIRRYINLLLTMLIGGLWHGAGWNFVLWGGIHGLFLIFNHVWNAVLNRFNVSASLGPIARPLTFIAVILAWVPFRATTFDGAINVYMGIFNMTDDWPTHFTFLSTLSMAQLWESIWILLWVGIVWYWPNTQQLLRNFHPSYDFYKSDQEADLCTPLKKSNLFVWSPVNHWAAIIAIVLVAALFATTAPSEFLYYQF